MKAIEKLVGKKVIIRSYGAGVFYGILNEYEKVGDKYCVELLSCRRLWYWQGAASLSQLATEGVKNPEDCKFTVTVDSMVISSVIEIIPTTADAQKIIEEVSIWKE